MPQFTPKRCPFLQGNHDSRLFKAEKDGVAIELDFKCMLSGIEFGPLNEIPCTNGCFDGNFTSCRLYAERVFKLSISIPIVCPLWDEADQKCTINDCKCDNYWIASTNESEDYRECVAFSKWFWEQSAKTQRGGTIGRRRFIR